MEHIDAIDVDVALVFDLEIERDLVYEPDLRQKQLFALEEAMVVGVVIVESDFCEHGHNEAKHSDGDHCYGEAFEGVLHVMAYLGGDDTGLADD